jgi:dienelactone hydrolase
VLVVPSAQGPSLLLQVTVFKPDGPGPFPLAVMNHGKDLGDPKLQPRYRSAYLARYFLSRGYAVVLPTMRGFAGSDGEFRPPRCGAERLGLTEAMDIAAVIDFMAQEPYVDPNRVIVAGQSFGGWNALAFGTLGDRRVKGLLNFAGGVHEPNCSSWEDRLIEGAEDFGSHTRIPSLWFYGDNDGTFPPSVWHSMHSHYVAAGGPAELVAYGRFISDAHNMIGSIEGFAIWMPKVDAFLAKLGLPATELHAEYLPMKPPPPSGYAAVDDVDAVPYLDERARETYKKFLANPLPRVFVLGVPASAYSFSEGYDPLAREMEECAKRARVCRPYAIDNEVVWTRPTPAPAATGFAVLADRQAVPFINDGGRLGYDKYLSLRKPKAFVIAPDGAWSLAAQGEDPIAQAMQGCQLRHQQCRLYAVDDQVVWSSGHGSCTGKPSEPTCVVSAKHAPN